MPSQLSQRLRAARNYADLRQQDIADACALAGFRVSRSAVAQWEYDDERKTTPSIEQVKVVAKRTGVPLEWLLNEGAEVADVWRAASQTQTPMPLVPTPKSPVTDRLAEAGAKAIEFAVFQRRPDLAAGFGQVIGTAPMAVHPDFLWKNTIINFSMTDASAETIGRILLAEQAAARRMTKALILLNKDAAKDADIYGIRVCAASSPDEAAQKLIQLCD